MELRGLTKTYPDSPRPAVEDVSLGIEAGETVVLVGPSGCGKSTTLKMINRLIEPTAGRISIDGEDVTGMDPVRLRRRVGYAIQSSGLFPHLTVAQNVALVPRTAGWDRRRIAARVSEMLDLVGLDPGEYRERYPRELSGGQRQRVGVARALAADPPVLLMDEPFGAVDPVTRGHLQDELIRLQDELRKTIVFVTHDMDEAIRLGDRIAVLRERSRVAQFDTPESILARPSDAFVAGFVGAGAVLKRLHLARVGDVPLSACATGREDEPPRRLRDRLREAGTAGLLLLDRRRRPLAWLRADAPPPDGHPPGESGRPVGDTVTPDASLRDALEAVVREDSGRVAVTGPRGEYLGVIDIGTLTASARALWERGPGETARRATGPNRPGKGSTR
ncbi:ATP-binding cassette domain-containing protein [Streptomyces sp. ZYX-F-203]